MRQNYPEVDEWTPIGEDTPKDFEEVLVSAHFMGCEHYGPDGSWCGTTKPHETVRKARYIENEWFCVYDEKLLLEKGYRVTAWQPLPKHYKEHKNEIGKWIQGDDGYYYCSLCQSDSDTNSINDLPHFCENCGARMESAELDCELLREVCHILKELKESEE